TSYRQPVTFAKHRKISCLEIQTRAHQPEFCRLLFSEPHPFGAQSRDGYHIRWTIDLASAVRAHCDRGARRRRTQAPSSESGLHRRELDDCSSAWILARVFSGRLNGAGRFFSQKTENELW